MRNKYENYAIIGGKNMTASYTKKGELLRIMYNMPDFRQFIDFFYTGIKVNDSGIIYLHDDINNQYRQYYTEDTNILNTEIENTYFQVSIKQTDFMAIKDEVLIKRYIFENKNTIDLNINFLTYCKLLSDTNNMVGSKIENQILKQYSHDYTVCTFSKNEISSYQLNDTKNNIESGIIHDKDYIGMSADSSLCYQLGTIKPGEKKELVIYMCIDKNEKLDEEALEKKIHTLQKMDINKECNTVEKYWRKYLKEHTQLEMRTPSTPYEKQLQKIYKRSILLFPLLTNQATGGIIAAVEVDENIQQSGRYAYCWPRDAVFIMQAFDKINMKKETEKFYKNFCKITQSKNGMWEQRFYTDGRLAPCWGYQIDETASVIYGIYQHYQLAKDKKFLKDTFKMCENAIKFLGIYLDNILGTQDKSDIVKNEIEKTYHTEERNKLPLSYDLWEENEGIHLYSLASIYAAFQAMQEIYTIIEPDYQENRLKLEHIQKTKIRMKKQIEELKKYISKNLYNETTKTLKRNTNDEKTDISVMGTVVPFNLFGAREKKILNTVEKINLTLRTYTGGYLRFEDDHYKGGKYPWTIATLWMALYYKTIGDKKKAKECIEFVVKSSNEHGFLGEQVDNTTMQPSWVNGLAWAHAMFILSL